MSTLARQLFQIGASPFTARNIVVPAFPGSDTFPGREQVSAAEARRRQLAAAIDEVFSEGRVHRNTREQRHE